MSELSLFLSGHSTTLLDVSTECGILPQKERHCLLPFPQINTNIQDSKFFNLVKQASLRPTVYTFMVFNIDSLLPTATLPTAYTFIVFNIDSLLPTATLPHNTLKRKVHSSKWKGKFQSFPKVMISGGNSVHTLSGWKHRQLMDWRNCNLTSYALVNGWPFLLIHFTQQ